MQVYFHSLFLVIFTKGTNNSDVGICLICLVYCKLCNDSKD